MPAPAPTATPAPSPSWPSARCTPPKPFAKPTQPASASSAKTASRSGKPNARVIDLSEPLIALAVLRPRQAHLIGPLQNNKTSKAAEIFDAIDTLDSLKTADRLNAAAQSLNKTLRVLIEVKLSPEDTKHGLAPEELPTLLRALQPLTHLEPRGLMTVPPFDENPETARPYFQHLRRLRDDHLILCPTLTELSMGMSNDFAVAIEEGSTTVRIGTAIFGKRTYA